MNPKDFDPENEKPVDPAAAVSPPWEVNVAYFFDLLAEIIDQSSSGKQHA